MNPDTHMTDPRRHNEAFLAYLREEDDGMRKFAAAGATYIRDHLREEGFLRRILPPENLDVNDQRVVVALDSDTFTVRKDLEPGSRAVSLSFGALADAVIVSSPRIDIPIWTIASDWYQAYEQHLLAYEMPITKLIERNTGKDMQEIEDLAGLRFAQGAIDATGRRVLGTQALADRADNGDAATGFRGEIQRPDLISAANAMLEDGNRKEVGKFLMNQIDFNNVMKWTVEDMGDKIESETVVDGYRYDKILGQNVVRSVKTDLLKTGNIWGFADPEFLGFFFILNDVKFFLDKMANLISWYAWEDIGVGFGNISSIVKLELYNGTADQDASSDALPSEADLFRQTNPAASGGAYFPQVVLG
jgi:hypothetical protein